MTNISEVTASDILAVYKDLESDNDHALCYLLLAQSYGSQDMIEVCERNRDLRDLLGYSDDTLAAAARVVTSGLYQRLVKDAG
jgi:hypothetical protein